MLALHVVGAAATTLAILLGLWQYDAWGARRDAEADTLTNVAARPLDAVMTADDPYPGDAVGRPVQFTGRWLPDDSFYVSDRGLDGRTGYWAVTPVAVCDGGTTVGACASRPAMLVVRGWAAAPEDAPSAPDGVVDVAGWLQPPEGTGVQDTDPSDDVLPQLRMGDAIQRVDQDLYGAYVVSRRPIGDLVQVPPASLPEPEMFTAIRNLLYALEWWVFAGFAAFIWWRWCRDEVLRETQPDGDPEHAPDGPGVAAAEVASRP